MRALDRDADRDELFAFSDGRLIRGRGENPSTDGSRTGPVITTLRHFEFSIKRSGAKRFRRTISERSEDDRMLLAHRCL